MTGRPRSPHASPGFRTHLAGRPAPFGPSRLLIGRERRVTRKRFLSGEVDLPVPSVSPPWSSGAAPLPLPGAPRGRSSWRRCRILDAGAFPPGSVSCRSGQSNGQRGFGGDLCRSSPLGRLGLGSLAWLGLRSVLACWGVQGIGLACLALRDGMVLEGWVHGSGALGPAHVLLPPFPHS